MGRCSRGGERASGHLWTPDVVHFGCARLHRLPVLGHRVRHSSPLTRKSFPRRHTGSLINSLRRIKALLFTLVRAFEFELALQAEDIVRKTGIVGRPVIASNPEAGPQLPLLIRLANTD